MSFIYVLCCFFYMKLLLTWLCDIAISFFLGTGNVSFSIRGITYQNNSLVTLEDIGEGDDALLCLTDQTACCRHPYTREMGTAIGNWSFPNRTTVPSDIIRCKVGFLQYLRWNGDIHGPYRRGGVTGIYSCMIPDAMNVSQSVYSKQWWVVNINFGGR